MSDRNTSDQESLLPRGQNNTLHTPFFIIYIAFIAAWIGFFLAVVFLAALISDPSASPEEPPSESMINASSTADANGIAAFFVENAATLGYITLLVGVVAASIVLLYIYQKNVSEKPLANITESKQNVEIAKKTVEIEMKPSLFQSYVPAGSSSTPRPASMSTEKSMSLSACSSPRATDPNINLHSAEPRM